MAFLFLLKILLNFSLDSPDPSQQGTSLLWWSPDVCEHRRGSTRWAALDRKVTPVSTVCSGSRIGMASPCTDNVAFKSLHGAVIIN